MGDVFDVFSFSFDCGVPPALPPTFILLIRGTCPMINVFCSLSIHFLLFYHCPRLGLSQIVVDASSLKPHASSLFTYSLEKKERPHKDIRAWPCNGCWVGSKLANPNAKPSLSSGLRPLLSTRAILRELVIFTMKARYLKRAHLATFRD